jgi:hypothetical protein
MVEDETLRAWAFGAGIARVPGPVVRASCPPHLHPEPYTRSVLHVPICSALESAVV